MCVCVCVCVCGWFNIITPAENVAAALAFSFMARLLEEKVKELTTENDQLKNELTDSQVDLRAARTDLEKHQTESQLALESLTKKCLALEEELSKSWLWRE